MNTVVKITCGCHTAENPQQFSSIEDASKHAKETNHTLHGSVIVNKK